MVLFRATKLFDEITLIVNTYSITLMELDELWFVILIGENPQTVQEISCF